MHDFSSVFTILPNGDNDTEAVLKETKNNFDRPIENGSLKISVHVFLIQREII